MSADDLGEENGSFSSRAAFAVGSSDREYRPDLEDEFPWPNSIEPGLFTRQDNIE